MLDVIIIEDEQNTLDVIVDILNNQCEVNISGTASTVMDSVQLLQTTHPDLVLLDVNLPDGTSFDILSKLESHDFGIIFITAFEEYALKAIKFSALDYLLKPINPIELTEAIKHAEKEIERRKNDIKLKAFAFEHKKLLRQPEKNSTKHI
jgi:two-component system LytT family response regulator